VPVEGPYKAEIYRYWVIRDQWSVVSSRVSDARPGASCIWSPT